MDMDRDICGRVWTSAKPESELGFLCHEIGPRIPGTLEMERAQRHFAAQLTELGASNVHGETVPLLGWNPAGASVRMIAPVARDYAAVQLVFSGSGQYSGPVVDVGIASAERLSELGASLKGAIALLNGLEVSGVKYTPLPLTLKRLAECGVRALVISNPYVEGCATIQLACPNGLHSLPAVAVSASVLREIRHYAGQRVELAMETGGVAYPSECSNLIADFSAPQPAQETILLTAHADTFYLNSGALDNLTGVLTVMEIARALAPWRDRFRRNLRVILFTGEEYGFVGSKAYVRTHASELDRCALVMNMDTLWPQTAEGMAIMGCPALLPFIQQEFRSLGRRVDVRNLFCMSSDYLPFVLAGVPAVRPADFKNSMPPWLHTSEDNADKVSGDWIRMNAMTFGCLLGRILTKEGELPVQRRTREQVREYIQQANATVELESMGFNEI